MSNINADKQLDEKIVTSNAEAIEKFLSWYGPDTKAVFSSFFLDLFLDFIDNEPDGGYSDEYKDITMLHIRMLKDLVQSLKMPYKEAA